MNDYQISVIMNTLNKELKYMTETMHCGSLSNMQDVLSKTNDLRDAITALKKILTNRKKMKENVLFKEERVSLPCYENGTYNLIYDIGEYIEIIKHLKRVINIQYVEASESNDSEYIIFYEEEEED